MLGAEHKVVLSGVLAGRQRHPSQLCDTDVDDHDNDDVTVFSLSR